MSEKLTVQITDNLPKFSKQVLNVFDDALAEASKDTLIAARQAAPFDKGALRRESDVRQMKLLLWRISFWVEYARFQEFGGDALRRVRNYTTSGTGAHFLQRSGDEQAKTLATTFGKHAKRVHV